MIELKYALRDDRVAIISDVLEEEVGGFHIPQNSRGKSVKGTVIGVGKGIYAKDTGVFIPIESKVGDRVLFSPYDCEEFEGMLIGKESAIIAVII